MLTPLVPIAALLLSVGILLMGNGLQGILLPIRANIEEFSTLNIGLLGSSYFLGFGAGCILGPRIVRRVGHIRAFTAMVSIASTIALVHALIPNPAVWWPLRAATGFCFAALYMIIESWLNERSTNATRGFVFSIYTTINLSVLTLGQLMITLHDPAKFPLFALASILISIAAVPVALTTAQAPAPIGEVRIRIRRLFKMSPVGFAGCLAVGLANGSFWSLGPVFAQEIGMDVTGIAFFMSITVIAGALGQWPLGHISDRLDRRKIIIGACAAGALAGVGMVLFHEQWDRGILVFSFLFGISAFPLYALSVAHTNDFVAPENYVEAASGLLLVYAAGAVVGPIIASGLMAIIGPDGLFAFTAAVHAGLAVFALQRMRMRVRPPEEERAVFTESLLTAQTVAPMDPSAKAEEEQQNAG
jgi:MFS family permease